MRRRRGACRICASLSRVACRAFTHISQPSFRPGRRRRGDRRPSAAAVKAGQGGRLKLEVLRKPWWSCERRRRRRGGGGQGERPGSVGAGAKKGNKTERRERGKRSQKYSRSAEAAWLAAAAATARACVSKSVTRPPVYYQSVRRCQHCQCHFSGITLLPQFMNLEVRGEPNISKWPNSFVPRKYHDSVTVGLPFLLGAKCQFVVSENGKAGTGRCLCLRLRLTLEKEVENN